MEKYDLFFDTNKIYSLPYPKEKSTLLKNILKSENYVDLIKLKYMVLDTVLDFFHEFPIENPTIKKHSKLIQQIITSIEENTTINLTVFDISKALFISESKIRNDFKKEMGITIGKYIDDMVFIKAKRLLTNSNSIAAVGAELGFCDQFYFSRRFKEKFKITPSRFKKENKIT